MQAILTQFRGEEDTVIIMFRFLVADKQNSYHNPSTSVHRVNVQILMHVLLVQTDKYAQVLSRGQGYYLACRLNYLSSTL